jgi:hypothetical protein
LFPAPLKAYDRRPTLNPEAEAMERQGDEVHVSQEEASGGVQPHIVRYVLGVSLLLVVVLLSLIWILGSVTR